MGYLDNLSSNAQLQLNGKEATVTGAASTITGSNLTASRATISNASGKMDVSSVTDVELGYVQGATSNLQDQINNIDGGSVDTTDLSGTTNQINLSESGTDVLVGSTPITLSLPQDVHSGATPNFAGANLSGLTGSRALISDGSKNIASSSVTETELGYLSGTTSNIQNQIDNVSGNVETTDLSGTAEQITVSPTGTDVLVGSTPVTLSLEQNISNTSTPTFANVNLTGVTANKALYTGASNQIVASVVTDIELGYLSGVTESIQDQLNEKAESFDVTDLVGTSDQILLSEDGTGVLLGATPIQISLPQNIDVAATPTFSTLELSNLTDGRVVINDGGLIATSTITNTELSYLDNLSGNVQNQINNIDASQIVSGTINIARIPAAALERLTNVADQAARYALTDTQVQNGDTVRENDTGLMYIVVDDTNLNNASGYQVYTAGSAASVPWSGVTDAPTTLQGYGITDGQTALDFTDMTSGSNLSITGNTTDVVVGATPVNIEIVSSPTFTGLNLTGLTADRVAVTDGSKNIGSSAVTTTELDYIQGLSSNAQNQLDSKADLYDTSDIEGDSNLIVTNGENVIISSTPVNIELIQDIGLSSTPVFANVELTNLDKNKALIVDNDGLISSSETGTTELGYISTLTSNAQTQINSKQDEISVTANRALESDGSGAVQASNISSDELNYLDGVTSNLQTQLDSKADDFQTSDLSGTANQVSVTANSGSLVGSTPIVISLEQDISTSSSPEFTGINISGLTGSRAVVTDSSSNLTSSTVTDVEVSYLEGATSNLQNQIDNVSGNVDTTDLTGTSNQITVSPTGTDVLVGSTPVSLSLEQNIDVSATPVFSNIELTNLTDDRAVVTENGLLSSSVASATEVSYLENVSSNIQTQLNSKEPTVTKGDITETVSDVMTISGGTSAVIGSGVTLEIKAASNLQDGYLTKEDWANFNASGGEVSTTDLNTGDNIVLDPNGSGIIIGTTPVVIDTIQDIGVASTPVFANLEITNLSPDSVPVVGSGGLLEESTTGVTQLGYINTLSSNAQDQLDSKENTLTKGDLTENTSSVLTISGGTGSQIGSGTTILVKEASGSQDGYLSSTNFNTFNNKMDSVETSDLTGTANQISLSASGSDVLVGSTPVQLSLPQDVHSGASPDFLGLNLSGLTAERALVSDGSKNISASSVTSEELGYVSGVTSSIQNQLDSKQGSIDTSDITGDSNLTITNGTNVIVSATPVEITLVQDVTLSATPTFSNVELTNLTDDRVVITESGLLSSSEINVTELNALDNISSNVQTQLNGKEDTLTKGDLTEDTSDILTISGGVGSQIGSGTSILVKQSSSSQDGYLSSEDWTSFNEKGETFDTSDITGDSNISITNGENVIVSATPVELTLIQNIDVSATPVFAGLQITNLNNDKVVINDTNGELTSSVVSSTELSYLENASSNLQTQINNIDADQIVSGTINIARLPAASLERMYVVADQTARYALTTNEVQNGDTVKENDTQLLYYVVDDSNLGNASGYQVYTAGTAASVEWSGVQNTPTSLSGYGITDGQTALDFTDINTGNSISITGGTTSDIIVGTTPISIDTAQDIRTTASPTFSALNLSGLTASRVAVLDGSKNVTSSGITTTELDTLDNISGNIQSALDGKEPTLTKGDLTESTSDVLTISGGTNSQIGSGTSILVKQAATSQDGYLSSEDWNTFNDKSGTFDTSDIVNGNSISLTGDTTDIIISATPLTIDTVQDIRTSASPTFTNLTATGVTSANLFGTAVSYGGYVPNTYITKSVSVDTNQVLQVTNLYDNFNANVTTTYPTLRLSRDGELGNRVPSGVDFNIGCWESSATDGRTQLDIRLTHGTSNFPEVNVMTLKSDQSVDIQGKLDVGSTILIDGLTADRAVVTDGSKNLSSSSVTSTELNYLDGTTSNVQSQIDSKANEFSTSDLSGTANQVSVTANSGVIVGSTPITISLEQDIATSSSPEFTGLNISGLTASRVNVTDSSKNISSSTITSTELETLENISGNVQTQLDSKASTFDTSDITSSSNITLSGDTEGIIVSSTPLIIDTIQDIGLSATPIFSNIELTNLVDDRVLVSESGILTSSIITKTELETLDDISGNVQSQLNSKENTLTKGNLTETNSNVLSFTGNTNAIIGSGVTIEVELADSENDGYLSSSDWNAFNDKADNYDTSDVTSGSSISITGDTTDIILSATPLNIDTIQDIQTSASPEFTGLNISGLTASRVNVTDGSKNISSSTITSSELETLDNISGNIQSQLDLKASTYDSSDIQGDSNITVTNGENVTVSATPVSIELVQNITVSSTPIFANIELSNLTNDRVPYVDNSGLLTSSNVDSTALSYIENLSSDAQSQINSKEPTLTKGDLTENNSDIITFVGNTNAVIGTGTSLEIQQSSSTTDGYLSSTDWNEFNNKADAGGVISSDLNGTVDQVNVSFSDGVIVGSTPVVLSLPQSIATDSDVTFNGLNLAGETASRVAIYDGSKNLDSSIITSIELESLDNISSNVQVQIDSKADTFDTSDITSGNSISLSGDTEGIILSATPLNIDTIQDIRTSASPQFTGLNVSGLTASKMITTDGSKNLTTLYDVDQSVDTSSDVQFSSGMFTDNLAIGVSSTPTESIVLVDYAGTDKKGVVIRRSAGSSQLLLDLQNSAEATVAAFDRNGYLGIGTSDIVSLGDSTANIHIQSSQTISGGLLTTSSSDNSHWLSVFSGHTSADPFISFPSDSSFEIGQMNNIDGSGGGLTSRLKILTTGELQIAGLTASRAIVTDASKNLTSSSTTDTEIGYISGVTSSVQAQIDSKADTFDTSDIDGTANQISVANGIDVITSATPVTLSLEQDIATTSTVEFTRLGLGTTAAGDYILDILDAGDTFARVKSSSAGQADLYLDGYKTSNDTIAQISFMNQADSVASITADRIGADDAADMKFYTQVASGALTERMSITSTGLVNIAGLTATKMVTTDASKNLATSYDVNQSLATTSSPTFANITVTGVSTANLFGTAVSYTGYVPNTYFTKSVSANTGQVLQVSNLYNNVDASVTTIYPVLRLTRDGKYGVRVSSGVDFAVGCHTDETTDGNTLMNINLTEGTSNYPEITVMTLRGDRKVGINTTTPNTLSDSSADFHVKSNSTNTGGLVSISSSDDSHWLALFSGHTGSDPMINYPSNSDFVIGQWSSISGSGGLTTRMKIDSDGNVGINHTNPQEDVHVLSSTPIVRVDEDGTNYTDLNNGVWMYGDHTCWDDKSVPLTQGKQGNTSKPDFDYTNIGYLFPQNDATEILYMVLQMPHSWLEGSDINPHIHWQQSADQQVTWKIDYKWFNPNAAVPAGYTTHTMATNAFTYTSGDLHQITEGTAFISGSGQTLSSLLLIKLYRDDDVYSGDALAFDFDVHYQINSMGSRLEFNK